MINQLPVILQLYIEFFKTGLFAIGGGMATLPFLSEMGKRTGWFTLSQLADMVAVAESTPGPIGINAATYVGYTVAGIPGGIIATLGLVTPSLIIIIAIFKILNQFKENQFVKSSFYFLRPGSLALIFSSTLTLCIMAFFNADGSPSLQNINIRNVIFGLLIVYLTNFVKPLKKLHPVVWILCGAFVGILILR